MPDVPAERRPWPEAVGVRLEEHLGAKAVTHGRPDVHGPIDLKTTGKERVNRPCTGHHGPEDLDSAVVSEDSAAEPRPNRERVVALDALVGGVERQSTGVRQVGRTEAGARRVDDVCQQVEHTLYFTHPELRVADDGLQPRRLVLGKPPLVVILDADSRRICSHLPERAVGGLKPLIRVAAQRYGTPDKFAESTNKVVGVDDPPHIGVVHCQFEVSRIGPDACTEAVHHDALGRVVADDFRGVHFKGATRPNAIAGFSGEVAAGETGQRRSGQALIEPEGASPRDVRAGKLTAIAAVVDDSKSVVVHVCERVDRAAPQRQSSYGRPRRDCLDAAPLRRTVSLLHQRAVFEGQQATVVLDNRLGRARCVLETNPEAVTNCPVTGGGERVRVSACVGRADEDSRRLRPAYGIHHGAAEQVDVIHQHQILDVEAGLDVDEVRLGAQRSLTTGCTGGGVGDCLVDRGEVAVALGREAHLIFGCRRVCAGKLVGVRRIVGVVAGVTSSVRVHPEGAARRRLTPDLGDEQLEVLVLVV